LNLNNLIGKIIQAFFETIDGLIVDIGFKFHQHNMIDHIDISLSATLTGSALSFLA
jgi:hypothetical protein